MNRLQTEFHRLYRPIPVDASAAIDGADGLIDGLGRVRALVLELARPADWELLGQVWRGVQADLGLPAPAIAVSGVKGLQLWFSLAEPLGIAQAHGFLASLCRRYLPDVAHQRLSLMPALDAPLTSERHARAVPALQESTSNWSAFVAPDLAPIFAETPWLDLPPGDDGQANLLSHLASIKPSDFAAAEKRLKPAVAPPESGPLTEPSDTGLMPVCKVDSTAYPDPRSFLLAVMNDAAVPLALRIDAAKALLAHAPISGPNRSADR